MSWDGVKKSASRALRSLKKKYFSNPELLEFYNYEGTQNLLTELTALISQLKDNNKKKADEIMLIENLSSMMRNNEKITERSYNDSFVRLYKSFLKYFKDLNEELPYDANNQKDLRYVLWDFVLYVYIYLNCSLIPYITRDGYDAINKNYNPERCKKIKNFHDYFLQYPTFLQNAIRRLEDDSQGFDSMITGSFERKPQSHASSHASTIHKGHSCKKRRGRYGSPKRKSRKRKSIRRR
jgi:hypothetical protein